MAALTSCTAAVYWNGVKVAKMRNFTPNFQRNELDTTGIGECVATSTYGLRRDTASAEIIYDPEDTATTELLNRIFREDHDAQDQMDAIKVVMQKGKPNGTFDGAPVITSLSMPVQVGELMVAQVSMSISGGLNGSF